MKSKPDYRKILVFIHLTQNDDDLLKECGFLKSDNIQLNKEMKTILIEQIEEYLDHIKGAEESVNEKVSIK